MSERARGRWAPVFASLALHTGLAAAFVYGWLIWKPAPRWPQVLAIDATVVDAKTLDRLMR
ncbi:MAG: hypothetical protein WCE48_01205, partial [Steroidobacteraceae bacterium]